MSDKTVSIFGIFVLILLYTAIGGLAGVIYAFIAPELLLPNLSLWTMLGVWWLWAFVFVPPGIFFASCLRGVAVNKQDE